MMSALASRTFQQVNKWVSQQNFILFPVTGILRDLTVGLLIGFVIFRFFMGMAKITTSISTNRMAGFLK